MSRSFMSRPGWHGAGKLVVVGTVAALALVGCSGNKSGNASSSQTAAAAPSAAANAIKIGVLTTCGGPFATFEQESFSGAKYALVKDAGAKTQGTKPQDQVSGATVAGKPISISFGCSDATPDKAVAEARRLVENVGVKI